MNQTYCSNSTVYNWAFLDGPFSDDVKAEHYKYMLKNCDSACLTTGTQWAIVYPLNAITMLTMSVLSLLQIVGVWVLYSRFIAMLIQPFFCLLNLCVVITTAVYRLSFIGQLAALSLSPSQLGSVDGQTMLVDTRTY